MYSQIRIPRPDLQRFISWARYLYWADLMRQRHEAALEGSPQEELGHGRWFASCAYYYASLYVVVEGWEQVGFKDAIIDALLAHTQRYKELLRRFRNGIFHYQPDLINDRIMGLLGKGEKHVFWVRTLHDEFVRYYWGSITGMRGTEEERDQLAEALGDLVGWFPKMIDDKLKDAETYLHYADEAANKAEPGTSLFQSALEMREAAQQYYVAASAAKEDLTDLRAQMLVKIFEQN